MLDCFIANSKHGNLFFLSFHHQSGSPLDWRQNFQCTICSCLYSSSLSAVKPSKVCPLSADVNLTEPHCCRMLAIKQLLLHYIQKLYVTYTDKFRHTITSAEIFLGSAVVSVCFSRLDFFPSQLWGD